ncbi:MAG: DMT family transporter [Coriobacteriia bacterium]|nr:DMT family transporter [Coriobacteriia bacterium]
MFLVLEWYHNLMPERLKYSLIMFTAGCCYGVQVPMIKTAQYAGFTTGQIMVTQYLVAAVVLVLVCLFFSRVKVGFKDALKLMGMGVVAASVSFFFYQSLSLLTPAMSLTLLFQFVWMGMVVQAVKTKTPPRPATVLTVLFVVVGAVFATGILDEGVTLESLNALGILYGFLSAVGYTAFLVLSSRLATSLPALNRSMFSTLGSVGASFAITPHYFAEPMVVSKPLLSAGIGVIGFCLPVVLIVLSSPKLPTGLTTVMASSELPSGVLCAAIFLGEPVTLTIGLGVVIVLLGIVASEMETLRSLRKMKE